MGLHPAFAQNTVAWPLAGTGISLFGPGDLDLTFALRSLQFPARDMQEISPLPDAIGELAIAPAERLALARPTARNGKWPTAIVVSGLLHGAAAAFFLVSPSGTFNFLDVMQSEGSDQAGDRVAGSALDEDPAAIDVTLEPDPQPTRPEPAKAARPVPPTKPPRPAQEAVKQAPEPSREAARPPIKSLPEAVKQPEVMPDILVAATPRSDKQSVAAKAEMPELPAARAESAEMPAVPDQPPIPSARPTPAAAPSKATDEKRGTADGQDRLAQAASRGKKQKEAGSDAAEFDYRSDVIRKLSRVNRAVPPSVQLTARNNAVVTFVIGGRGGIDELRILQTSGSPNFDQVVLGIVRKAAPSLQFHQRSQARVWCSRLKSAHFECAERTATPTINTHMKETRCTSP
ncbi:TonB C-terminal domain-containing protein [Mesorhizobium sp. ORM6]